MAQKLEALASMLEVSANLVPLQAVSVVSQVINVARLACQVLESNDVSEENRQQVEHLSQRAFEVTSILEQYLEESRSLEDEAFRGFVLTFNETMADVEKFVVQFTQRSWLQKLMDNASIKSEIKASFDDLQGQLDAITANFTKQLLKSMISNGPYQRIQHPLLRTFWERGMGNVQEAKWRHFWDQLVHEFTDTQKLLAGASADGNRRKLETRASPRNRKFVGPWEINNIFQPPKASIVSILQIALGEDETTREQHINEVGTSATHSHNLSLAGQEAESWNGYWVQNSLRGDMSADLFFSSNDKAYGGGEDLVGTFTWTGKRDGTQVHVIKQYIGAHRVRYNGEIKGSQMDGVWHIKGMYGDRGAFHLEKQIRKSTVPNSCFDPSQFGLEFGKMQRWSGYYVQFNLESPMYVDMVLTYDQKIFGDGSDGIGQFTWLGRYRANGNIILVDIIKQYAREHVVFYSGAIRLQQNREVAMLGSWVLSHGMDEGKFLLEIKDSPDLRSRWEQE